MSRLTMTTIAAIVMLAPLPSIALDRGIVSQTDPRVRLYDYAPEEVYALTGYFGQVTSIFFREDEEIETISAGDSEAWDVTVAKNKDFVFIKPVLEPARRSNLIVVTDLRTYIFDLTMGALEDGAEVLPYDLTFRVRFNYPYPPVVPAIEPDDAYLASLREEENRREERELARQAEESAREESERVAARARQDEAVAKAQRERDEAMAKARSERETMLERLRAPSVVFDETEPDEDAPSEDMSRDFTDEYRTRIEGNRSDDRVFLDDAADRTFDGEVAYLIDDLSTKILQGSFIQGVMETALDSTLTGMIRGSVSEDVLSHDASQVLIPRGSRLIGEYRSAIQFGTARVLVAWNRVIRPDGASIDIGSPGTDQLGQAGMTGFVDTQWPTRFGAAALISVFEGASVYALAQLDQDIGRDSAEDISDNAGDNFGSLLEPYLNIPTTIHIDQGARVIIYVARDLDFGPVEGRAGANALALR